MNKKFIIVNKNSRVCHSLSCERLHKLSNPRATKIIQFSTSTIFSIIRQFQNLPLISIIRHLTFFARIRQNSGVGFDFGNRGGFCRKMRGLFFLPVACRARPARGFGEICLLLPGFVEQCKKKGFRPFLTLCLILSFLLLLPKPFRHLPKCFRHLIRYIPTKSHKL